MEFYKFNSQVRKFLIAHHWDVEVVGDAPFPLFAKKKGAEMNVICLSSLVNISATTVSDSWAYRGKWGPRPLVCVTANPVSLEARIEAVSRRVNLLHYTELRSVAELNGPTSVTIEDHFDRLRLIVAPPTTMPKNRNSVLFGTGQ
jgi:hypothetical protein